MLKKKNPNQRFELQRKSSQRKKNSWVDSEQSNQLQSDIKRKRGLARDFYPNCICKAKRWELNKKRGSHKTCSFLLRCFIFFSKISKISLTVLQDFGGAAGAAGTAPLFAFDVIDSLSQRNHKCNNNKVHYILDKQCINSMLTQRLLHRSIYSSGFRILRSISLKIHTAKKQPIGGIQCHLQMKANKKKKFFPEGSHAIITPDGLDRSRITFTLQILLNSFSIPPIRWG